MRPVSSGEEALLKKQMSSTTREAIFGLLGIVIFGIVLWLVFDQARVSDETSSGQQQSVGKPMAGAALPIPTRGIIAGPPSKSSDEPPPTVTPTPQPTSHTVREGATLNQIAALYGVSTESLAIKNNLSDPNQIFAGQRLEIPLPDEALASQSDTSLGDKKHRVQPGDTLWQIAQQFAVSIEAIMSANNMAASDTLFVGKVLTIPDQQAP
tara:strand:- start:1401 stop:2030 length:630 start_codon:yes stop_codon:yes gene_type:complete